MHIMTLFLLFLCIAGCCTRFAKARLSWKVVMDVHLSDLFGKVERYHRIMARGVSAINLSV